MKNILKITRVKKIIKIVNEECHDDAWDAELGVGLRTRNVG